MRIKHEIFNAPNAVKVTLQSRPNPGYEGLDLQGKAIPKTLPMWRVQTIGEINGTASDRMFGLVSRPLGFLDSPDAEIMSGGVNTKSIDAVAIARHGNYLHWGFIASPTHMTPEARLVFINAVHYISKFDSHGVVARKVSGTLLRKSLHAALTKKNGARLAAAKPFFSPEIWKSFDGNIDQVVSYVRENGPYLRRTGRFTLGVDEDLKTLGISNAAPNFLEQIVTLLDHSERTELARKILTRYTLESFEAPEQWKNWINENRAHFFFSEAAGYKWLVNRPNSTAIKLEPNRQAPLAWSMKVTPDGAKQYKVEVEMKILEGWYAYDRVPKGSPYAPLKLTLDLPKGVKLAGKWQGPTSLPSMKTPGLSQWKGSLKFAVILEAELEISDPVSCTAVYQICNDQMCLRKTTETKSSTLRAE